MVKQQQLLLKPIDLKPYKLIQRAPLVLFFIWNPKNVTKHNCFSRSFQLPFYMLLIAISSFVNAEELTTAKNEMPNQVSFSEVLALTHNDMTTKLTYGDDENQFIEVWAANERNKVEPASAGIVLIHGGCWMSEYGVDHVRPLASALSDQSYNVFAIEYRRTGQPGGGWPGSLNDAREAIKTIREAYPKMALSAIGHSAGGHLAMLTGTDPTLRLTSVIALAPITDIATYAKGESGCQKAAAAFMGGKPESNQQAYALANTLDKRIVVPLYILGGKTDKIVPVEQIKHNQARRFIGENIGHFDWVHPQTEAFVHIMNTLGRLYE